MTAHARDDEAVSGEQSGNAAESRRVDLVALRKRSAGIAATLVRWVCSLFALVLVAHVVLVVGGANPDNGITRFVASWANFVVLGFQNLFAPADPALAVLVNYGIAAVFWLVISAIVVKIIRLLG